MANKKRAVTEDIKLENGSELHRITYVVLVALSSESRFI